MTAIHPLSTVTPLPQFDLFSVPPTQTTVEKTYVTEHRPINALDSRSYIEFVFTNNIDECVNLSECLLYLKPQVSLGKATPAATDWEKIVLVNNYLHSM